MIRSIPALALAVACVAGCGQSATGPNAPPSSARAFSGAPTTSGSGSNINGIGGAMPAYYDGSLFTINFTELPSGGESANLLKNGSINIIYQSDGCMPGGQMFVSVIDAIQGDGFNPLWQEVQVVFTNPRQCQQFKSDDAVKAAAAAGVITLQPTTELYRCSVIGKPN